MQSGLTLDKHVNNIQCQYYSTKKLISCNMSTRPTVLNIERKWSFIAIQCKITSFTSFKRNLKTYYFPVPSLRPTLPSLPPSLVTALHLIFGSLADHVHVTNDFYDTVLYCKMPRGIQPTDHSKNKIKLKEPSKHITTIIHVLTAIFHINLG